jgi:hypothetical protein
LGIFGKHLGPLYIAKLFQAFADSDYLHANGVAENTPKPGLKKGLPFAETAEDLAEMLRCKE